MTKADLMKTEIMSQLILGKSQSVAMFTCTLLALFSVLYYTEKSFYCHIVLINMMAKSN